MVIAIGEKSRREINIMKEDSFFTLWKHCCALALGLTTYYEGSNLSLRKWNAE
jgi:hypothetical protein